MSSPRLSNVESLKQQHYPPPPPPPPMPCPATMEAWLDDACLAEADQLVKTVAASKAKGAHPELIATIVSRYAARWLPELGATDVSSGAGATASAPPVAAAVVSPSSGSSSSNSSPSAETSSTMAAYMKKRFFVETLAGTLFASGPAHSSSLAPPAPPCNFLLRLLRVGTMVGADPSRLAELEARAARQLDQASLRELMIPAFSHTCGTLLDVALALRLVRRFAALDETVKSGAAIVKVAKLVDSYLAEAAVDANLGIQEFEALASALPPHARPNDDGLYRAVDTYLKAHPATSKQDRKALFRLMDTRKLSPEASIHAARNERLPVRAAIQVLFAEQSRVNRGLTAAAAAAAVNNDWNGGSFSGSRSPGSAGHHSAVDLSARCPSRRETASAAAQQQFQQQQQEIRKLREDVARLQVQCHSLQSQLDRMLVEKHTKVKKKSSSGGGYYSRWKSLLLFRPNVDTIDRRGRVAEDEDEAGTGTMTRTTPTARTGVADGKGRKRLVQSEAAKSISTPPKWRYSTS